MDSLVTTRQHFLIRRGRQGALVAVKSLFQPDYSSICHCDVLFVEVPSKHPRIEVAATVAGLLHVLVPRPAGRSVLGEKSNNVPRV